MGNYRAKTAAGWVNSRAEPNVNKWKLPEYVSNYGENVCNIEGGIFILYTSSFSIFFLLIKLFWVQIMNLKLIFSAHIYK